MNNVINKSKKWIGAALFCCSLLASEAAAEVNFRVYVYDTTAGKPAADATIILPEIRQKFSTDPKGYGAGRVPESGLYTIRAITTQGEYRELRFQINRNDQLIKIFVGNKPAPADDEDDDSIVITGRRNKQNLSRYRVRLDEIKRIPGLNGEAMRGLETLPGVNSFGAGGVFGNTFIRGADSWANYYLLDDLPIGYVFHFIGLNAVIHNDLIQAIDIYTGAYPAEYGDATGGIISIETIDEVDRFGGHTAFSIWSANALFKNQFLNEKGYWIAAARGSYMERTLSRYVPDGIDLPRYGDAQFKAHYSPNPQHSFYVYALGARDTFAIDIDERPSWDPTTELDPRFIGVEFSQDLGYYTSAIRHIYRPGSRISNTLTLYKHNILFYSNGKIGDFETKRTLDNGHSALKNVFAWEIYPKHVFVDIGLEARWLLYKSEGTTIRQLDPNDPSPDLYDRVNPDFETVPVSDRHLTEFHNAYMMFTFKTKNLTFKPGVRAETFGMTGQTVVDPRATLSYKLPTKTTLIAGGGVYHKVPLPWEYSPTAGNPNLRMERAEHIGVGVEQKVGNWLFKLEGYRHFFNETVVEDPYITTPIRVNPDNYEIIHEPLLYNDRLGFSNDGTGYSEGVELYIKKEKKPDQNGWFGWVSFTWSRTLNNDHQHILTEEEQNTVYSADERRILMQYDNTKDELADYDRPYIFNLVLGYRINREWQLGLRWKYTSGTPYTPIIGDDNGRQVNNGRVIFDPEFSELKNSERLGPTNRVDIRVDHFLNYQWGFGNIFVEMINFFVHKNPENMNFSPSLPYSAANPSISYAFDHLAMPGPDNKRVLVPLFNLGIEMKF